nr:unnamed protein product [Callosobruchus analis]
MEELTLLSKYIRLFLYEYSIGKYFGLVPPFLETRSRKALCHGASFICTCLLAAAQTFEVGNRTITYLYKQSVLTFLEVLQAAFMGFFVLFCAWSSFRYSNKWKVLFTKLIHVEATASRLRCRLPIRVAMYKTTVFSVLLVLVAMNISNLLYLEMSIDRIGTRMFTIMEVFIIAMMCLILQGIEKQYEQIYVVVQNSVKWSFEEKGGSCFHEIRMYYKECNELASTFNDVFSWTSMLIFVNSYSSILVSLMWSFDNYFVLSDKYKVIVSVFAMMLHLSFSTAIVISCDNVIKKNEKLTRLCYILQVDVTDEHLIEELNNFAYLTTQLQPKFTAGGFFTVNQNFFSAFLTSVASYCIICIQFNVKK